MWGKNSAHVTFYAYMLLGNQLELSLHVIKLNWDDFYEESGDGV